MYNDTKTAKDRFSKKTKTGGIFAKRGASLGKALDNKISKSVTKETKGESSCKDCGKKNENCLCQ